MKRDLSMFRNDSFERGAPPWKEWLWRACSLFAFELPLPLPSALRRAVLRVFGARIGEGVVIRQGVRIKFPWRLRVGEHVWIGEDVRILNLADVEIDASVCLSQECFLCTGSHDFRKDAFDLVTRAIRIRHGAWIALRAVVGPGVTVGEHAVVSAGSVAVRDIPDGVIARGNPALWAEGPAGR